MSLVKFSSFFSIFALVGCVTAGPMQAQKTSVLDGTWRETFAGCVNGEPTPEEQRINEALHTGQVTSRLHIEQGVAEVEIISRQKVPAEKTREAIVQPSADESYCRLTMDQRWSVIGNHVEVTDLKINQKGFNGNKCQGSPMVHDPRVHNYFLSGDRLIVYMNSSISVNALGDTSSVLPSQCKNNEPQTVIFRKIP